MYDPFSGHQALKDYTNLSNYLTTKSQRFYKKIYSSHERFDIRNASRTSVLKLFIFQNHLYVPSLSSLSLLLWRSSGWWWCLFRSFITLFMIALKAAHFQKGRERYTYQPAITCSKLTIETLEQVYCSQFIVYC